MPTENLTELIRELSPQQQDSVREFVLFLKQRGSSEPFLAAVDEFIEQHPELLRRLAQ